MDDDRGVALGGPQDGWRPKLVVSDLDGTLLHTGATLTPRTWDAIQRVRAAGVPFLAATGRSVPWLTPLTEVGYDGLAVCDNGALGYDVGRREVLFVEQIPAEVVARVIDEVTATLPGVTFAVQRLGDDTTDRLTEIGFPWASPRGPEPVPRADLLGRPVVKLAVARADLRSDEVGAAVREVAGDQVEAAWSQNHLGLVEVTAFGVNKAFGVARMAEFYGVAPADVLAFGDMVNDLSLLAWAGRSVAPASASREVLDVVDEITGPHDEDGVADYLELLFADVPEPR